jgi:hypothetical protein
MRTSRLALAVLLAAACARGGDEEARTTAAEPPSSSAEARTTAAEPSASRAETDGAVALVREYVARDARGERMTDDGWWRTMVTWPEEPGWDMTTVVRAWETRLLARAGDTARVEVRYAAAGILEPVDKRRWRFVAADSAEVRVFTVVATPSGWRIDDPQMEPHVSRDAALRAYAPVLSPEDAERLRAVPE